MQTREIGTTSPTTRAASGGTSDATTEPGKKTKTTKGAGHAAPYERSHAHLDHHVAGHSNENRAGTKPHRPEVMIDGNDDWPVGADTPLLQITSESTAIAIGHVPKDELVRVNDDAPRNLNGTGPYVFVWSHQHGPGWMLLASIAVSDALRAKIGSQAASNFAHEGPSQTATGPNTPYKFRPLGDAIASDDHAADEHSFVLPHQNGANKDSDYLQRNVGTRTYYNVCLNLPSPGVPIVADDTAQPGDMFFVRNGPTFHQEIALFALHGKSSSRRQAWVFGFLGKIGPNGVVVPDPHRRGWVPLRDLTAP